MTTEKIALIQQDSNGKWIASYNGCVIARSGNQEYAIKKVSYEQNDTALALGITGYMIVDGVFSQEKPSTTLAVVPKTQVVKQAPKFSINERFEFLENFVGMVARREIPSLIMSGDGGLGKTFTVNKTLKHAGMISYDDLSAEGTTFSLDPANTKVYRTIKGYTTPKGLFRTLYENRNKVIIFDDTDSVFKNDTSVNLLKAALDSYDKRIISWNSESFGGDDDLPKSFEFTGCIIFITNKDLESIDQAVRSRALCVDVSMTTDEKIDRMRQIVMTGEFMPNYADAHKFAALGFIESVKDDLTGALSLRSLITVTKVAASGSENWKRSAEYLFQTAA